MPYKVGIDARSLRRGHSGVATYVANLLVQLPQLDPIDDAFPGNNLLWHQLRVPFRAVRRRWNLYHAPSYTAPLLNVCPTVLSVHDVSYLADRDWYPYALDGVRKAYYIASIRCSSRIIVPSQFSFVELKRLIPGVARRIRQVPLGVADDFKRDPSSGKEVRRRLGLPERFLLHVGDIHARRRVGEIEAAARQVGLPLVLVGRILPGERYVCRSDYLLSGLSVPQLVGVYNAATVFVYASVYEGFGLPLLEAMACGLPVVAANRASIPEVSGNAAVLVEPEARAIFEGIQQVLDSRHEFVSRGLDRARQFRWEETASKTRQVYQELL